MNINSFIYIFLLIICAETICAQSVWEKEVKLLSNNGSLKNVLRQISTQASINLIYDDLLVGEKKVSVDIISTARNALTTTLNMCNLDFKRFGSNSAVIYAKGKFLKKLVNPEQRIVKNIYSSVDTEITKPILLSNINLYYPKAAIEENINGEVLAKFQISKEGIVKHVILERSSGHKILDTATMNYVKKLKYQPAEYNGKPHEVWTTLLVKYDLE